MSGVVVLIAAAVLSQAVQSPVKRSLDPQRLQHFVVRGPLDEKPLEHAVARLTASLAVPFGLELVPKPPLPERVSQRRSEQAVTLDFVGLSLADGLNELLKCAPAYTWRESNGVINVLPKTFGPAGSFLDTPVKGFELRNVTARQAIEALHRQFDPGYPSGPKALPGGMSVITGADADPQEMYKRRAVLDQRPVSISVQQGTVRDVLNQIIALHGSAAWVVDYSNTRVSCSVKVLTHSPTRSLRAPARAGEAGVLAHAATAPAKIVIGVRPRRR